MRRIESFNEGWKLFWLCAKIGVSTFGGGYAMLPMFQKECIEKRNWITEEELMDYIAVGQCTPGLVAINTSTFVGYKRGGLFGSIISTSGMVFPSLIIITIIAMFLQNFSEIEAVKHAFAGIRVCVTLLIVEAAMRLWKKSVKDRCGLVIFCAALILLLFFKVSPILVVFVSAFLGIIIQVFKVHNENKSGEK